MTPPQLQDELKRELQSLNAARKQLINALNFQRIHNWVDAYRFIGVTQQELEYAGWTPEQLNTKPTRNEALGLINKREQDIYAQQRAADYDRLNPTTETPTAIGALQSGTSDCPSAGEHGLSNSGGNAPSSASTTRGVLQTGAQSKTSLPLSWTPATQHPLQTARLWAKQEEAAAKAYDGIITHKFRGQLLQAATGAGKTFVLGAIVRRLYDNKWAPLQNCISPWPIVYITKSSIVEQTERVLRDQFGLDTVNQIKVINIEQLRANFGSMFIEWTTLVESGNEYERPVWHMGIHPILFIWDECHILKNVDSLQSQIAQDVNNIERRYNQNSHQVEVYQLFASATPFTRVCEAKCFAVATQCSIADFNLAAKKIPLTNALWSGFAKSIAAPADPDEHSPGAIERLVTYLMPYIVDVKGLRPQFHPNNHVEVIDFETDEAEQQYATAWNEYLKAKAELEEAEMLSSSQIGMMVLANFTILRKKSEWIRAPGIAMRMIEAHQKGYASVGAFCFKVGITRAVMTLIETYNIPRHRISLIWGGASPASKAKMKKVRQKFSDKMTPDEQQKFILAMQDAGMDANEIQELLDDTVGWEEKLVANKDPLGYETYDKIKLESYKLGAQSKRDRQEEIDRFQSGHSWFCFFTFKAGGVGLSLHHTDELTKEKVIKHPNGDWALESSIANIPVRPRKTFVTPTFSAIELVQGLGRAARLTSLSDTEQILLFYRGTIEERVAYIVSTKLKCLRKVVRQKESWEPMILNASKDDDAPSAAYVPPQISDTVTPTNNNNTTAQDDDEDSVFVSEAPDED